MIINFRLQKGGFNTRLILLLIAAFWVWFFRADFATRFKLVYEQHAASKVATIKDKIEEAQAEIEPLGSQDQCATAFPKHASKFRFKSNDSDAKLHARMHVNNEHAFSVLIVFHKLDTEQAFGAVILHPNQSSQASLPIGQYTMALKVGEEWCNLQKGFSQGAEIFPSQEVNIRANKVTNVTLTAFGQDAEDVMVSLSHSLGVVTLADGQQISGSGSLMLQRVVGGHYAIEGSINEVPVNFMVDTGATTVAVSENFARHAGITDCIKTQSRTANGLTDVCLATAKELTIGQFKLNNVEVAYGKGMSDDLFLLGMNVIGLFKMEQQGDVMKLSLK